jgi:hypothetical protein
MPNLPATVAARGARHAFIGAALAILRATGTARRRLATFGYSRSHPFCRRSINFSKMSKMEQRRDGGDTKVF